MYCSTSSSSSDSASESTGNDVIFGDSDSNVGFTTAQGLFYTGDVLALITKSRVANRSGLNNIGNISNTSNINNLSGNINLKNEFKINFNNDANNSIGSQDPLGGVELKGFNNVRMRTSITDKHLIIVGQGGILMKGTIRGQTLTNTTERNLMFMDTTTRIVLGDTNCESKVKGIKTTFETGNELEVYNYIKFLNATTSSYIVNSTGNALLSINTAIDLINIFGNGVDKTNLRGSNIEIVSLTGEIRLDGTYIEIDSTQELLVKSADKHI